MDCKLDIRSVSKAFRKVEDGSTFTALHKISLQVSAGELLTVVGPSGCGKTTLLRLIAGLESTTEGEIWLIAGRNSALSRRQGQAADEERSLSSLPGGATVPQMQAPGRRRARVLRPGPDRGMVFQEHLLFPWLTLKGNVGFGLRNKGLPKGERERVVAELLELVGLQGFADNYPKELSGGMRKRAGIARALATDPEILLMDEPFGSVDAQTRMTLQEELLNIWERTRKTIVFVTHSVEEAVFLSDRVVVMQTNPGRIAQDIPVNFSRPRERTSPEFNGWERLILDQLRNGHT